MVIEKPTCSSTDEGKDLFTKLHAEIADDNTERNIEALIRNTGLDYVGQGDSRVVLVDETGEYLSTKDACVVKINKYGENDANTTEFENWQRMMGEVEKYLMRITDWDTKRRWLVMPYVSTDVTDGMMKELEKTFLRNGWKVRDVNNRNCARVQDRAVLIDYDQYIEKAKFDDMAMDERMRLIDWKYE